MQTGNRPDRKKKRIGPLIFRALLIVLISLMIGGTVYTVNARRLFGNALPMPFGFGVSIVLSGSMEPTLSVNDMVVVLPAESYQVGDVVIYQSGQDLIIHRIIAIDDEVVITQGDANNIEDAPFSPAAIKGRMILSVPGVGAVVRILQTTPATILLIVLSVLLMRGSWKREQRKDDIELDQIKEEIRRLKEQQEDQ